MGTAWFGHLRREINQLAALIAALLAAVTLLVPFLVANQANNGGARPNINTL